MNNIKLTLLASILFLLCISCGKDTLVFPEKVDDNGSKEPIDVFVKPTDVKVVGDYNQIFIFQWPKFSDKMDKVKITYEDGAVAKEILVSDFSKNYELITESLGEFEFKLVGIAKDGTETASVSKKATNKGLYIADVIRFLTASSNGFNVDIKWQNSGAKNLSLTFSYTDANGAKNETIESISESDVFSFSGLHGSRVSVELKDEFGNVLSKSFTYSLLSSELNTAATKAGWTGAVSSNHEGDGGGAAALIDGNPETFWHSPWGGTILPWPHSATITLNNVKRITKFELQLRHNNGTGAPRDFDFQTSADGTNFTTVESFVNTSTTAKAVIPYELTNSVETRYVRLLFKTSINNLAFVSLAEINFTAIQLEVD
ncbi:discoidin domain-containing protein [Sphingobacterium hungaricum]